MNCERLLDSQDLRSAILGRALGAIGMDGGARPSLPSGNARNASETGDRE